MLLLLSSALMHPEVRQQVETIPNHVEKECPPGDLNPTTEATGTKPRVYQFRQVGDVLTLEIGHGSDRHHGCCDLSGDLSCLA